MRCLLAFGLFLVLGAAGDVGLPQISRDSSACGGTVDGAELYRQGEILMSSSSWAEAEECFQQLSLIVAEEMAHAVYFNLGLCAEQLQDDQTAVAYLKAAATAKENFTEALNNLAALLMRLDRQREAVHTLKELIRADPSFGPAYYNLGFLYLERWKARAHKMADDKELKLRKEVQRLFKRAIKHKPDFYQARNYLAVLYSFGSPARPSRDVDGALRELNKSLAISTNRVALILSSQLLHELGRMQEAYERANMLRQIEDSPTANSLQGGLLVELQRFEEAVAPLQKAVAAEPSEKLIADLALSLIHVGRMLEAGEVLADGLLRGDSAQLRDLSGLRHQLLGNHKEALAEYERAVALERSADHLDHLGLALLNEAQYTAAAKALEESLRLKPASQVEIHVATVYNRLHRPMDARDALRRALKLEPSSVTALNALIRSENEMCEWTDREKHFAHLAAAIRHPVQTGGCSPFDALMYPSSHFGADFAKNISIFASRLASQRAASHQPLPPLARPFRGGGVLRVGFMSSDFRRHPVGLTVQFMFEHLSSAVEVHIFSENPEKGDGDPVRAYIKATTGYPRFHEIHHLNDRDAAMLIRANKIDILVDLNGHTHGSRLGVLALRPARIQALFLGFAGTSGAPYIDYFVGDAFATPQESHFTEALALMPNTFFPTDHARSAPEVLVERAERKDYGLPEDAIVLGMFNSLYKVGPAVFSVWLDILDEVPEAVLWLPRSPTSCEGGLRSTARARGLEERLIFFDHFPAKEHLIAKGLADLCLDTPLYTGHRTAADILWAGVPLLTLAGDKMSQRVAGSLLMASGLPHSQLIVSSMSEYKSQAIKLLRDRVLLTSMRVALREQRTTSPLFDLPLWTKHFETALHAMQSRARTGQPPASFTVPDTSST